MQFTPSVNSLVILATNNSVKSQEKGIIPFLEIFNSITSLQTTQPASTGDESNDVLLSLCQKLAGLLKEFNSDDSDIKNMPQDELGSLLFSFMSKIPAEQLNELETIVDKAMTSVTLYKESVNQGYSSLAVINEKNVVMPASEKTDIPMNQFSETLPEQEKVQEVRSSTELQSAKNVITIEHEMKPKTDQVRIISTENSIKDVGNEKEVINFKRMKSEFESQFKNFLHENVKEFREVIKNESNQSDFKNDIEIIKNGLKGLGMKEEAQKNSDPIKFTEKLTNNSEDFIVAVDNKSMQVGMKNITPVQDGVRNNDINIVSQIVEKIDLKNIEDGNIINIKLKPDSLGNISIKVQTTSEYVKAEIITDNVKVKEVVMKQLNELTMSLQEKGIRADSIKVSVREMISNSFNQYQSNGQDTFSQSRFHQNHQFYKNNLIVMNQDETVDYEQQVKSGSLVNVYV
ncbi:MAG: flagellar hook-length control protein FliK [Clostridia bacterium]|nr:flagellar hook-length control protein FliK [Clostridia bacterium]